MDGPDGDGPARTGSQGIRGYTVNHKLEKCVTIDQSPASAIRLHITVSKKYITLVTAVRLQPIGAALESWPLLLKDSAVSCWVSC